MSRSRRFLWRFRALALPCLILAGLLLAAQAAEDPGEIAPPTAFTSGNDFLTRGYPLNGEILVTSPLKAPQSGVETRSGADLDGHLARARLTDPAFGLGDFLYPYDMSQPRHGAGVVLARGPVPEEISGVVPPPPNDAITYLYIVGGKYENYVLPTIERAQIDADGFIHPGNEPYPTFWLLKGRFGAAVVARDNFIYVIGGYDEEDEPLNSIERLEIDAEGQLGESVEIAQPGWGGDVAATIVNGYLYVIGGNTLKRGPDEGAVNAVRRAAFNPDGTLGTFEPLDETGAELPLGTAGGRAFVIASWDSAPAYHIYYVGGNVGNVLNGATTNVYRMTVDPITNEVTKPWESIEEDGGLVRLNDPRELFATVVSNGYVYVIGGETTQLGQTTYYSTVERAPIRADGSIGQFVRLDGPNATFINGLQRASDMGGVAFNNKVYVAGGRDASGASLRAIFKLDLDQAGALLETAVPDAAVLDPIHDMGADMYLDSLSFGMEQDAAEPGAIMVRFRWAQDQGAWSAWSRYVSLDALPVEASPAGTLAPTMSLRFLDLTYPADQETGCSAGLVPNPTGMDGPIKARYLEYEVMLPGGGMDQKFHDLTLNAHPILHRGLPGGYHPVYAGQPGHAASCAPNNAIADQGAEGWLRFEGFGLPAGLGVGNFRFGSGDATAPYLEILEVIPTDSRTLDMKVRIPAESGGPFDYSLYFNADGDPTISPAEQTLLATAIRVHPSIALHHAPAPGLDLNPATDTMMENVVEAPSALTGKTTHTVAIFGANLRSGRVNDMGPLAIDDPTSSSHWPANPYVTQDEQPPILRYKLTDVTPDAAGFDSLTLAGAIPGDWVTIPEGQVKSDQRFDIAIEVPHKAKSGPHDLEITIQNPQLGSTVTVKQTVHVVPAFAVDNIMTKNDPTPDPNPGTGNNYDWKDASKPAMADLGDGEIGGELHIGLTGYGFESDRSHDLIRGVAYDLDAHEIGPYANAFSVDGPTSLDVKTSVPMNGTTGIHRVELVWRYEPEADGYAAGTHVPPMPATPVDRTWPQTETDPWLAFYVAPQRVGIHTVLGASNTQDPTVLLASDPTLTINGQGFAIGGPAVHGFEQVLCDARLKSLSNSPMEDIVVHPPDTHMISDGHARLTMAIPDTQRPGEMYQLEVQSRLNLPATSKVREPYTTNVSQSLITVLPLPQCAAVTGPTSCLTVMQGGTLDEVTVTGQNFDAGTRVDLGPGITATVLSVCNDAPACPTEDVLRFRVEVAPTATPGARTLQIENGPTVSLSQKASCSQQFDLWVVPVPALTTIQPSLIQQPPRSVGSKIVPVDIYGANFMPGATVTVTPSTGVSVHGPVVVVDSGHITTELLVTDAALGDITLEVSVPSGPACMAAPQRTSGTFKVSLFPEIGIASVVNSSPSQCQGRTGTIQVTGSNFRDPSGGGDLVDSAFLGTDVSIDSLIIHSASSLTVSYSINDNAALGARSLILNPIAQGATPATYANALTITSSPSITSVSPQAIVGGTTREVTISGRNFYEPGAAVTVDPADNVQVLSTTVMSTGQILATIRADLNAAAMARAIIVTNSDGGQCNVARFNAAVRVIPEITITAVANNTSQCQGRSGSLTVTGTNFNAGISTASLGPDVSIDSLVVNSATTLTINYSVSDGAAVGSRALVLTPAVQGASMATFANALVITPSPSIISISPPTIQRGTEHQVTITGRNFLSNALLAVDPPDGVTVSALTVVSSGQMQATLQVDPNAALTARALVVTSGTGTCNVATFTAGIRIFDPPHVTKVRFRDGTLRITGTNLHTSIQAFVGASTTPWPYYTVNKTGTLLVLKKAKQAFPKGIAVTVRLVNPDDGGETTFVFTR